MNLKSFCSVLRSQSRFERAASAPTVDCGYTNKIGKCAKYHCRLSAPTTAVSYENLPIIFNFITFPTNYDTGIYVYITGKDVKYHIFGLQNMLVCRTYFFKFILS